MKTLNVGLIGLGGIGTTHFHNCLRMKNVRLVAVADTSKKARSLAKAKGVEKTHENYEKLLEDPVIDCVIISLPTFLHAGCAIEAAEHGKHVFVEKPLARNPEEGEKVVSKTRSAGVKVMVGYPLRFSEYAALKNMIADGQLGDVVSASATNVASGPFFARYSGGFIPSPVPSWWFDPKLTGGGALIDLGSHMINLLCWYFGNDVVSVKSVLGHRFNLPLEDHALCTIKFATGVLATVNVGWYARQKSLGVELFGTAQTVSISSKPEKITSRILQMIGTKPATEQLAFQNELSHFFQCVINDQTPLSPASDALNDLRIISQAYENQV